MEQWWKEIDEAGIDAVVVNGRYVGGMPDFCMDNDTLAGLQNKYKGRFFGLSQVNLDQDPDKTAQEVERAIKKLGMAGANLEPGYQTVGLGKMGTFTDNPSFWPILEVLNETGAFLLIQTGLFAGTDISFNNPQALGPAAVLIPEGAGSPRPRGLSLRSGSAGSLRQVAPAPHLCRCLYVLAERVSLCHEPGANP